MLPGASQAFRATGPAADGATAKDRGHWRLCHAGQNGPRLGDCSHAAGQMGQQWAKRPPRPRHARQRAAWATGPSWANTTPRRGRARATCHAGRRAAGRRGQAFGRQIDRLTSARARSRHETDHVATLDGSPRRLQIDIVHPAGIPDPRRTLQGARLTSFAPSAASGGKPDMSRSGRRCWLASALLRMLLSAV